jgi:hypothetical protein
MGWAPAGERSRIESRRCASSTPQPRESGAEAHTPLASGPRWSIAPLIRSSAARLRSSNRPMIPAIPHICTGLLEKAEYWPSVNRPGARPGAADPAGYGRQFRSSRPRIPILNRDPLQFMRLTARLEAVTSRRAGRADQTQFAGLAIHCKTLTGKPKIMHDSRSVRLRPGGTGH